MSRRDAAVYGAPAVALLAWWVVSREPFPLVLLVALALVAALLRLGPSDRRPDPRDAQHAAEDIARRPRSPNGL